GTGARVAAVTGAHRNAPGAGRDCFGVDRFHSAHWPGQGDFASLRLSDFGKWHLSLWPFAHPLDAVAGGVGHSAGCHRGRVHHQHHHRSYPTSLRFARHPQTHDAPRMKPLLLVIVPLMGAALAALWPSNRTRPWLLPVIGLVHVVLVFWLFVNPPLVAPGDWLGFDPLARAVLPVVSLLFLVCAAYGVPYLKVRSERPNR